MTKWIALFVVGTALAIGSDAAQAARNLKAKPTPQARFMKCDVNHDGVLTLQEFVGRRSGSKALKAAKAFHKKDVNGDGVLTFAEFMIPVKKKHH